MIITVMILAAVALMLAANLGPTILDILRANHMDAQVGLLDESVRVHPELGMAPARTIPGTGYHTLVRTQVGNAAGSFREYNAGTAPIRHTYETRRVECYVIEPRFKSDVALADAYLDGPKAYMAINATGTMEGETQGLCTQFYYGGTALGHPLGFPGLLKAYDAENKVIDAAGTTEGTCSSVWLLCFGPQKIQWVWGNGGSFALSPIRIESQFDPDDPTKQFDGYVQTMVARPGLQINSKLCAVRIKHITEDTDCTLTDDMLADALELFPAGWQPDVILMTRRSLRQLQKSRVAVSPTGAPPPFPSDIVGLAGQNIPIRLTDAILNTETLAL